MRDNDTPDVEPARLYDYLLGGKNHFESDRQAISDSLILAVVGPGSTGFVSVFNTASNDSLPGFVYTYDSTRKSDTSAVFKLLDFSGAYTDGIPLLQWQAANDGRACSPAPDHGHPVHGTRVI